MLHSPRNAWHTPNASQLLENQEGRVISLPGSLWQFVSGALGELTRVELWEAAGDATPDETAQFFASVYEEFLMSTLHYVGELRPFIFTAVPPYWLPMDGTPRALASYPELALVLPAGWVSGANFTLPSMAGAAPVGDGVHTTFNFVAGAVGGERQHTLTVAELATHFHDDTRWAIANTGATGTVNKPSITPQAQATATQGSSTPHNNMQPYVVVRWAVFAGR